MTTLQNLMVRSGTFLTTLYVGAGTALAQTATGNSTLGEIPKVGNAGVDFRTTILNVLNKVLTFMALLAVVFIVVAGIRLVVSQGSDEQKDAAKKTIIYVIIGLVIILLASAIVNFVAQTLGETGTTSTTSSFS
jgi:type IV secretory pathway VirB2 component (pilin)